MCCGDGPCQNRMTDQEAHARRLEMYKNKQTIDGITYGLNCCPNKSCIYNLIWDKDGNLLRWDENGQLSINKD